MEHETSKEKSKKQLNSDCHGIKVYETTWKQDFWSISNGMTWQHYLDATTSLFECHRIEVEKN